MNKENNTKIKNIYIEIKIKNKNCLIFTKLDLKVII